MFHASLITRNSQKSIRRILKKLSSFYETYRNSKCQRVKIFFELYKIISKLFKKNYRLFKVVAQFFAYELTSTQNSPFPMKKKRKILKKKVKSFIITIIVNIITVIFVNIIFYKRNFYGMFLKFMMKL